MEEINSQKTKEKLINPKIKSIKSLKDIKINNSDVINTLKTKKNLKNEEKSYNKNLILKNTLFDLFQKPITNFSTVESTFDLITPKKITPIKKMKTKTQINNFIKLENFKIYSPKKIIRDIYKIQNEQKKKICYIKEFSNKKEKKK